MIIAAHQYGENVVRVITDRTIFMKQGKLLNFSAMNITILMNNGSVWIVNDKGRNVRMLPTSTPTPQRINPVAKTSKLI